MSIHIYSKTAKFNSFYGTFDVVVPAAGIVTYAMSVSGTHNLVKAKVSGDKASLTYSIKINNVLRNVIAHGTASSGTSFKAYGYTYKKS
jgi:hypothetical protein